MSDSSLRFCAMLELSVFVLQILGVTSLCVTRLLASKRWACHGRTVFLVAVVGLGITGALCGRHDSEFALFAGSTLTMLLIGMTIGNGGIEASLESMPRSSSEPKPAR